jgi:hypothetical protein
MVMEPLQPSLHIELEAIHARTAGDAALEFVEGVHIAPCRQRAFREERDGGTSREVTGARRLRLLLDSSVLVGGIVFPQGLDKATPSHPTARLPIVKKVRRMER